MKRDTTKQILWVHEASHSYRRDEPVIQMETVWIAHPGWGYIQARDLWVSVEKTPEELEQEGFIELSAQLDGELTRCPHCNMVIGEIPGSLISKHIALCGGSEQNWQRLEERMITDQRIKWLEARILAEITTKRAEQEEAERKERFGKIRDDMLARQHAKDRKKRLKEQVKQEWKKR